MNNTFDWQRFCQVVKKDLHNLWPMFGTTMLILAVLPFALWLLIAVIKADASMPPDFRLIMIEGVAMIAAYMAPSRLYRTWNLRNEGIYFAMLPASKLEKYLSAVLYSLIICPLAVYLGGIVLDLFLTLLPFGPWRDWLWQGQMGFPFTINLSFFENMAVAEEDAEFLMYYGPLWVVGLWTSYICSVLMFIFTSTLFKKHKVLQTFLWLYLIEFVLSVVLTPIAIGIVTAGGLENLGEWIERFDPELVFRVIWWASIIFNVLLAALFGWLSWRRLNRMAY